MVFTIQFGLRYKCMVENIQRAIRLRKALFIVNGIIVHRFLLPDSMS